MSSAAIERKYAQALCGSEKGRAYAGDDHEAEHPALRHDIHGMYRRSGDAGNKPYLPKNDPKYAAITESERKMAEPLEDQGQASQQDESSCVGTVASFSGVPGTGSFFSHQART